MFIQRTLSGAILLAAAIFGMYMGGTVLACMLLAVAILSYRELMKAIHDETKEKHAKLIMTVGFCFVVLFYLAFIAESCFKWSMGKTAALCTVILFVPANMLFYVLRFPEIKLKEILKSIFSFVYGPVMLGFIYLTRVSGYGKYLVWLILICAWGCDTCAYCVGMLIGKKKIFPVLSPKKSLEGCIGGVVGTVIIGLLYGGFFLLKEYEIKNGFAVVAVICVIGAVAGMLGDLGASAIKREYGIKDYSKLIPGHGGVMDRFDSMIAIAPIVYVLSELLLKTRG
ncbi:MAG: phosphatidate cytidylyltransferase [Lachnospiraceae bacterium]|nr:phosphatidate cytidylyltransferase [Lachnospiraceae bacterium]